MSMAGELDWILMECDSQLSGESRGLAAKLNAVVEVN